MSTFFNLNFDKTSKNTFFKKHVFYFFIWSMLITVLIFRVDLHFLEVFFKNNTFSSTSVIPILLFVLVVLFTVSQGFFYGVVFIFYPFLLIFWFIPKSILRYGKIYLFIYYLEFLYSRLNKLKWFITINSMCFLSIIFVISYSSKWSRIVMILFLSFLYIKQAFFFMTKGFRTPRLFDTDFEENIKLLNSERNYSKSLIVTSYIIQKNDNELDLKAKRKNHIKRMILANYSIQLFTEKLNSSKGRSAYIMSWLIVFFIFLFMSVLFFWIINYQLFQISDYHFDYTGNSLIFDFLYYTLKTITFGGIEIIKPLSITSRVVEIFSYSIIGVFLFVFFIGILLSLNQDRVNENVKLTLTFMDSESTNTILFLENEYKIKMEDALKEVGDIDYYLIRIKKFINKIF